MAQRLTATVVVYRDGVPVVLMAGDDLPAWAEGLVGSHALSDEGGYESMTVAELNALIEERGIEIESGAKKDAKVAALVAADGQ